MTLKHVWSCSLVIPIAVLAFCLAGCSGSPVPTAKAPAVSPFVGPGVTSADLASAMQGVREARLDASRMAVLDVALKELGKKYVLGGNGPDVWDCSGLVKHSFAAIGVELPRYTFDQVDVGRMVNRRDILPGDLLFFNKNGHVAVYIGNGLMLHAHRAGVIVECIARYHEPFSAARRVLPAGPRRP